jgi:hypothetical protein
MSAPSDPATTHARFLKAELGLGFTFATIASRRYETGSSESAGRSVVSAEKAYETVARSLSDPKHSKELTVAEIRDLTTELEKLREELTKLDSFRT